MSSHSIRTGHWVVVCDGRKAIILENAGDEKFINLRAVETLEHPDRPTHEQGVSAPGRTFAPVTARRSAVHETDLHDESERSFLHDLAERLGTAVASGRAKAITLVAAPRALGVLRQAYSPALAEAITREIAKDLVKHPIGDIEQMLTKHGD